MPAQDDVPGYFSTLSNWGRWGDEDQLGTLNHITDDVRLAAARAVRHGRSVSCAWEVAVPDDMERAAALAGRRRAATAAGLGQWDFHLAVAPVRFAGTSGSPVSPIATF
jgi:hypothetical protein